MITGVALAALLGAGCEDLLPLPQFNQVGGGGHGGDPVASGGGGTSPTTGGSGGMGAGGHGAGGAGEAGFFDDLEALSDEFTYANDTPMDDTTGWTVTTLDPAEAYSPPATDQVKGSVWGNALLLGTVGLFNWWAGNKGFLMYKEIGGNFYVETDVEVFEPGNVNGTDVPIAPSSGAGLLVRDPQGKPFSFGDQTWVSIDRSTKDGGASYTSIVAFTDDVQASSAFSSLTNKYGRLAICRWAGVYSFYYEEGGTWTEVPLPANDPTAKLQGNVQVGMFLYVYDAGAGETGVKGEFDYVRFRRPRSEADCKKF